MKHQDVMDKIRSFKPSVVKIENRYLEILASALDEDELQKLMNEKDLESLYQLQYAYDRIHELKEYHEKQDVMLRPKNEPVSELLGLYTNKKSGKVSEARKKLQKRFLGLEYSEQMSIIRAMLCGSKSDREWCYNTLRGWWSDELQEDIMNVWNEYHEERCGWIVTKYMPTEVLRIHEKSLSYHSNYYQLCNRLAAKEWFNVDADELAKMAEGYRYLWIMSRTNQHLPKEEAMDILYTTIAMNIVYYKYDDCDVCSDNGRGWTLTSLLQPGRFNYYAPYDLYMRKIKNMDKMLSSLCRLGYSEEVREFLVRDDQIHQSFQEQKKNEIEALEDEGEDKEIYKLYVQYYEDHFPEQYKYIMEKYEKNYSNQKKREYYHIMGAGSELTGLPLNDKIEKINSEMEMDDIPF